MANIAGVGIHVARAFLANPAGLAAHNHVAHHAPPLGAVIPINTAAAFVAPNIAAQNAAIAAATLIIACVRTVASNDGVAGGGINVAVQRAITAANAIPIVPIAGGATLGEDFINAVNIGNVANAITSAINLISTFVGAAGAAANIPGAHAAGIFAGGLTDQALHVWGHIAERCHLWTIPVALTPLQQTLNYIVWNRAARVGTPNIPAIHTSFIIPPGTAPNQHFANILQAADIISADQQIHVSWGNAIFPAFVAAQQPALAGANILQQGVNLHLDIGVPGVVGMPPVGNIVKCDLRCQQAAGGSLNRYVVPNFQGGAAPAANDEAKATLTEAISSLSKLKAQSTMVANAPPPDTMFHPILNGGAVRASIAAPAATRTITICVNTNRIATIFPE